MQNTINKKIYMMLLEFTLNFKVELDRHDRYSEDFEFGGPESSPSQCDIMNMNLTEISEEFFLDITNIEGNILNSLISIRKSLNVTADDEILELEVRLSEYN